MSNQETKQAIFAKHIQPAIAGNTAAQEKLCELYKDSLHRYHSYLYPNKNPQKATETVFKEVFSSIKNFKGEYPDFAVLLFEFSRDTQNKKIDPALSQDEELLLALLAFFRFTVDQAAKALRISVNEIEALEKQTKRKLSEQLEDQANPSAPTEASPQSKAAEKFSEAVTQAVPQVSVSKKTNTHNLGDKKFQPEQLPSKSGSIKPAAILPLQLDSLNDRIDAKEAVPTLPPPVEPAKPLGISNTTKIVLVTLILFTVALLVVILWSSKSS